MVYWSNMMTGQLANTIPNHFWIHMNLVDGNDRAGSLADSLGVAATKQFKHTLNKIYSHGQRQNNHQDIHFYGIQQWNHKDIPNKKPWPKAPWWLLDPFDLPGWASCKHVLFSVWVLQLYCSLYEHVLHWVESLETRFQPISFC